MSDTFVFFLRHIYNRTIEMHSMSEEVDSFVRKVYHLRLLIGGNTPGVHL